GDMENYAQAKHLLFTRPDLRHVVLNADDAYGQQWLTELQETLPVYAYSLNPFKNNHNKMQKISVHHMEFDTVGMTASVHTPWGDGVLHNPYLMGRTNLSNLLAVLAVLGILEMPLKDILLQLAQLRVVPGR